MHKNKFTFLLLYGLSFALGACSNSNTELKEEKSVQEIMAAPGISNSEIIRSPVSAQAPADTVNVAKMSFEEITFDFGSVREGTLVEHTFNFTNTGKKPLLISNARSTCGCTVPEWPREPIMPGKGGQINVRFNTENKSKDQVKPITITANTYPATNKVYLQGFVEATVQ